MTRRPLSAFTAFVLLVAAHVGAMAQTIPGDPTAGLPPALQAAILSGNGAAVDSAISSLSGGNPQRAAQLAVQLVAVAERLLATNPQAAIEAAGAALGRVQNPAVLSAAPQQTSEVAVTATRILVSPTVLLINSERVASLGNSILAIAATTNNPAMITALSNQVVTVAEKLVATRPADAIALAGRAVDVVKATPVLNAAPQGAMGVVTVAARIIIAPSVQQVAPALVGQVAASTVQVAMSPAAYAAAPAQALTVAANAYAAASNSSVAAANPNALQAVVQTLVQAANNTALAQARGDTGVQINLILEKKGTGLGEEKEQTNGTKDGTGTSPS